MIYGNAEFLTMDHQPQNQAHAIVYGFPCGRLDFAADDFTLRESGNKIYTMVGTMMVPRELSSRFKEWNFTVVILYGDAEKHFVVSGQASFGNRNKGDRAYYYFTGKQIPIQLASLREATTLSTLMSRAVGKSKDDQESLILGDILLRYGVEIKHTIPQGMQ